MSVCLRLSVGVSLSVFICLSVSLTVLQLSIIDSLSLFLAVYLLFHRFLLLTYFFCQSCGTPSSQVLHDVPLFVCSLNILFTYDISRNFMRRRYILLI